MPDYDTLVLAPNFAVYSEVNNKRPVPLYTPPGGAGASGIDGIFRIPSVTDFGHGEGPGITTRKPELDIRESVVRAAGVEIVQRGTFQVRGVAYEIADVRPDGEGLITLELTEALTAMG